MIMTGMGMEWQEVDSGSVISVFEFNISFNIDPSVWSEVFESRSIE
jgi:hypothetical protein